MQALHYKSCPAVDHSLDCLVAGHAVPRGFGLDALIPRAVTRDQQPSATGSLAAAVWCHARLFFPAIAGNRADLFR